MTTCAHAYNDNLYLESLARAPYGYACIQHTHAAACALCGYDCALRLWRYPRYELCGVRACSVRVVCAIICVKRFIVLSPHKMCLGALYILWDGILLHCLCLGLYVFVFEACEHYHQNAFVVRVHVCVICTHVRILERNVFAEFRFGFYAAAACRRYGLANCA